METVEVNIAFGTRVAGAGAVTEVQFGAVQTGFSGFDAFAAQFGELGLKHLRWPGGTLSETRPEVYGLNLPGVFDATDLYAHDPERVRPDLADTLAYCVEQEIGFSMIVPTLRHVSDIEQGVAELQAFMADLLSGRYGGLPDDFTLEIGNEYIAHAVFADNPALYGQIADRFVQTIVAALESPAINKLDADIKIAVQMGYDADGDAAIRGALSSDSLAEIDSVVAHALPYNFSAIDRPETDRSAHPDDLGDTLWQNRQDYFEAWQEDILNSGGNPDALALYMSAMTIGQAADTVGQVNLAYQDYGLRAAGAWLELFATYQSIGMDAGDVWGVAVQNLNAVSGDGMLDPGGAMIKLMAENIVGMELIDGFQSNDRGDLVMTYAYENATETVIFVAANDIPAQGVRIEIGLDLLAGATVLEATRLTAVLSQDMPAGTVGTAQMIYEEARLQDFTPLVTGDAVAVTLGQDYEVVMLHLAKGPVSAGPTPILGGAGNDRLIGLGTDDIILCLGGDDVAEGNDGNDRIEGGDGNDLLRGNRGNDVIDGGAGHDRLYAGVGDDVITGGTGNDLIKGDAGDDDLSGDAGNDRIEGGTGNDTLSAGDGADKVYAGADDDLVTGGAGNDSLFGGDGADRIFGGDDHDFIQGGTGDDWLYGGAGRDLIEGEDGDDIIFGGSWSDTLVGGDGQDMLSGGDGRDTLRGNSGDDTLEGGAGDDLLVGGAGADLYLFGPGGFGADQVRGYQPGLDLIDLSALDLAGGWSALAANHLHRSGENVVVDLDDGTITLLSLSLGSLTEADFIL